MLQSAFIKIVKLILKKDFSKRNKIILTNLIIENLGALPLHDIIKVNEEGTLLINNRSLEYDQVLKLRDSSRALQNNHARKVIREQVKFAAIATGVHRAKDLDEMLFAKAALWWGEKEDELVSILSGGDSSLNEI